MANTREKKIPSKPHALPKCIPWSGETALNQINQLLLVTEQGLGDTLQFMRYVNALRQQGATVSFCAQPKLHTLIQASAIDPSPLTPKQANQVNEGQWIPLLSVPRHLEVSPDNPVINEPYIKTTDELIAKWADTLEAEQRPIIGINWQGNPKSEKTGLRGRSIALETFAPIIGGSQISLLSLQKGFGSEQLIAVLSRIVLSVARIRLMTPGISWRQLPSSPTAIWSSPAIPQWLIWQGEWERQPGYCSKKFLNGAGG